LAVGGRLAANTDPDSARSSLGESYPGARSHGHTSSGAAVEVIARAQRYRARADTAPLLSLGPSPVECRFRMQLRPRLSGGRREYCGRDRAAP
jgi:hypothetical protein